MGNLATIGTSIHKDSTTNTTWNPRSKFKTGQTLETSHLGCRNQVSSRFSFNLITINCDTIKSVKHNHKTSDTTVTDNQITGITKHHPRNVMLISKFDNTREFIAVTWKGQIICWTTNLGICITF